MAIAHGLRYSGDLKRNRAAEASSDVRQGLTLSVTQTTLTTTHRFRRHDRNQPGHAESASVVVSATWYYATTVTAGWVRFVTARCIGKASLFFDDVLPILRQQVLLARNISRLAARRGAKLGQHR